MPFGYLNVFNQLQDMVCNGYGHSAGLAKIKNTNKSSWSGCDLRTVPQEMQNKREQL